MMRFFKRMIDTVSHPGRRLPELVNNQLVTCQPVIVDIVVINRVPLVITCCITEMVCMAVYVALSFRYEKTVPDLRLVLMR